MWGRYGGGCEGGWFRGGKVGVGEEVGGWNDGSLNELNEVCQFESRSLTASEENR